MNPDWPFIIVYRWIHAHSETLFIKLEVSGRTPKSWWRSFLYQNIKAVRFQCSWVFTKHLCLFALEAFVCFKLPQRAAPLPYLCVLTTTLKPCHWFILPDIKVTLTCIIQSHSFLAPTVQAARHMYCCTVEVRCNFLMCYHLWEWGLFIDIPLDRQYSTIYLYVLFIFSVSKCPPYLYCTYADDMKFYVVGFICFVHDGLFAHLPLQLPLRFILWWFYVMIMSTYQMKEHDLMQQSIIWTQCSVSVRVFRVCIGKEEGILFLL